MYKIILTKKAIRCYSKLPGNVRRRITDKLMVVAEDPYRPNNNVTCMQGFDSMYRLRVGDYRVVYNIDNNQLIIDVIKIGHRKEVYN